MNNRTLVIAVASVMIMGALGYLFLENQEVATPTLVGSVQVKTPVTNKLPELEDQIKELSLQVAALLEAQNKLQSRQARQSNTSDEIEEGANDLAVEAESVLASEVSDIDPFSPEGIALSDENQSRYISQVGEIYNIEELDSEWAHSVESAVMPKLADMTTTVTTEEGSSEEVAADITVANFECRSKLCSTEIIAGTMDEMLAYQNHMVIQTKSELPSIVFGVIKPYGNKFSMEAYLARDEYDFPAL